MECRECHTPLPEGAESCPHCGAVVEEDHTELGWSEVDGTIGTAAFDETIAPESAGKPFAGTLEVGVTLGGRYRIESVLGKGGMGAVYKATDIELEREVAIKVIRPELAEDPRALQRFKQEIILAREVTHRNVVRIFDLGQADGIKFISMEYIDGKDLHAILQERGAMPVEEAVGIIEQVCLALDAAHQEGVVHRDLKPHNVMIDPAGRVVVMDFGIARSVELSGMTATGSLLGTPDYMSPEQVKGEPVDARSDLFALGIIFYQLLTGELPYVGETPMAAMYTRTQKKAAPVRDLNPDLPGFLGDIVGRCLEIPVPKRYQSAREILQDLAVWRGGSTHMTIGPTMHGLRPTTTVGRKRLRFATVGAAAAMVVVVLAAVGFFALRSRSGPSGAEGETAAAPAHVVSLAILPFANVSGNTELDWLGPGLAEMLRTDVGQSAELRVVSSDRLHQILRDLRITPGSSLDEVTLRRVAEFSNADTVVWGQFAELGEQIRIDATVRDFQRHETATVKAEAADEQQLLRAVQELAQGIRDNLALSSRAVKDLEKQAFIPSASSVVALRHYNQGLELLREGNNLEAVKLLETTVEEDPGFALAHSKLAQAYQNLGRDQKAEEASRSAAELSKDLPPQERYMILAQQARITGDYEAGIDAYQNLLRMQPSDADLNYELALLYEDQGSFDLAREHLTATLEADPQNVTARLALGRVLIRSGQIEEALAPLNQAMSQAIQAGNQEAHAYALQALGVVYRRLGRLDEALKNVEESLAIKRKIGDQRGMAVSLSEIGYVQDLSGDTDAARESYQAALKISREIGDDLGVAQILVSLGDLERIQGNYDKALEYTREGLRIQIENGAEWRQAQTLHNIGTIYDQRGEYSESLVYYQRALDIRERLGDPSDIADTLHNMAETHTYLGRFKEAQDLYLRALEKRREAQDELGAAVESYSLGRVFGYQGRYAAALDSIEEALELYRRLQETGRDDVEALAEYGDALSLLGRFDEAGPPLDQALARARQLEDDALIARILKYQADRLFYMGEFGAARAPYQDAEQAAIASGDPYLVLAVRTDLARNEQMRGNPSGAVPMLESSMQEAESRGATYLRTLCAICLASAQIDAGRAADAERLLRRTLGDAENMGASPLVAQSHHLLAEALRRQGNEADAARQTEKAAQILDEIQQEAGSDGPLKRADLSPIAGAPSPTSP